MIVHFLIEKEDHKSEAACGLAGPPSKWPANHLFACDWSRVNCKICLKVQSPLAKEVSALQADLVANQVKPRPNEKREPAYDDTDRMPFGKHRGEQLRDVPAAYLCWLWSQRPINDIRLQNYISNSLAALKKEHPDGIWE